MRTLNRPMFRYGGPIKEGVMNGIREPKKNGGMLLVGQHPKKFKDASGREQHFAPLIAAGSAAMRFLPAAYRGFKAARAYKPFSQNLGIAGRLKDIFKPSAGLGAPMAETGAGAGFRTGSFLRSNPLTSLPLAGLAIEGGAKAVKGLAGMTPGALKSYANTVIPFADPFTIDKEKVDIDINKDPNLGKTTKELGKTKGTGTDAEGDPIVQLTDKEKRAQQIQKYRDIVDIKGMNKGAAYDSLIAASQAISGEGDFKGSLKDGSLINKIIQSTSKAFDKPKATKDAIDTLILKGEIEADIAAGKAGSYEKQVAAVAKNLGVDIKTAQKMLIKEPVDVRSQVVSDISTTKQPLTHKLLVSSVKKQIPGATVLLNADQAKDKLGENQSAEDYLMTTDIFNTVEDPSGVYIIGQEVVQVDKKGNTTTLFP